MRKNRKLVSALLGGVVLSTIFGIYSVAAQWNVQKDVAGVTNSAIKATNGAKAAAYFGTRYFTTIESAVNAANETGSAQNVYVIPGVNPTINESFTISSNITLILPYEGTTYKTTPTTYVNKYAAQDASTTYMKSKVTVASGVTITIDGTLIIGGDVNVAAGGSAFAGGVATKYAQLAMNDESHLVFNNGSKLELHGYISEVTNHAADYSDDEDLSTWPTIELESGSVASVPFIIHDYRGGSVTTGIYSDRNSKHVIFFNEYEIANIKPLLNIDYGAKIHGNTWLSASNNAYESKDMPVIGNTTSYLFQIKDSASRIVFKYNFGQNYSSGSSSTVAKNATFATNRYLNFMDVRFYGNFQVNSLTINAAGTSLDTSSYRFALSYLYHLRFYGGSTSINNMVKMMGGSYLEVYPDASLTTSDMIIYEDYVDGTDSHNQYPVNAPAPIFINNGVFTATKFAGIIQTSATGATTTVSTASVTSYEHLSHSGSSFLTSCTYTTINGNMKIKLLKNGSISSTYSVVSGSTYFSTKDSTDNYGWFSNSGTIVYNSNGGSAVSSKAITLTNTGYQLAESDLPSTTRTHYDFDGWYMDSELTEPALGKTVYSGVTLYAKWTPKDYTITYHFDLDFDGNPVSGNPVNDPNNPAIYNIESNYSLYPAINGDLIFDGWYRNSDYTNKVTAINSNILASLSGNYNLDLYGRWYPVDASTYVITYINSNTDEGCTCIDSEEVLSANLSALAVPDLSGFNNDTTYGKYFDGWYLNSDYSTKYTSYTQITGDTILYAKWLNKNLITVMANGNPDFATGRYLNANQTFTVPNASSYGLDVPAGYEVIWGITGGDLDGQSVKTGDKICLSTTWGLSITVNGTLQLKDMKLTVSVGSNYSSVTVTVKRGSTTIYNSVAYNSTINVKLGDVITLNISASSGYSAAAPTAGNGVSKSGSNFTVTGEGPTISLGNATKNSSSCLLPDTLITMADGSLKQVKDIVQGDLVKVFNHETGEIDIAPITFNDYEEAASVNVINLYFSNGSYVGVVSEHGFFDLDTMRYEYIDETNYQDFIGHRFYVDGGSSATLDRVTIEERYTEVYSPVSFYHLDLFVEDMLSMPGGITGLFNIFEYADNLQYDQEAYARDIETYGLFTYEDLAPLGVTEIMFEAYAGKYLKVALGKGILTEEYLAYLIERYGGFTE